MSHLGFWLSLLSFPVVGAVVCTGQLRASILNNCDTIFQNTASPLCQDPIFIETCTNFFVMAEICRWTRCGFIPQYPDSALLEVVEIKDIRGYQNLVNLCGTSVHPLCQFARTILTLAQQCNSVCKCIPSVFCNPGHHLHGKACPKPGTVCCLASPKITITPSTSTATTRMTTTTPTTTSTTTSMTTTTTTTPTTTSTTTSMTTTTTTSMTTTTTTTPTTTSTTTSMTTTTTTSMTTTTTTPTTTSTTTTPIAFTCVSPGTLSCTLAGGCLPMNILDRATCPGGLICCFIGATG